MEKMEFETSKSKIEHLNLALRAVRNVNRLLVREKDRKRLLKGICDILIKNRGYDQTWIVVLDDSGKPDIFAESNIGKKFIPVYNLLKQGKMIDCAQKALKQNKTILIKNPSSSCKDCPLSKEYAGWGAMTVPLGYERKIFMDYCLYPSQKNLYLMILNRHLLKR